MHTEAIELMPGIRCLVAPNPGMMTGPGTNTYLVGTETVAVIDPGPAIDAHIERIVAVAGAPISKILVTHTHPDHSPAAAQLAARSGAEQFGLRAPQGRHQDQTFKPDRELVDGEASAHWRSGAAGHSYARPRVKPPVLSAHGARLAVHWRSHHQRIYGGNRPARRRYVRVP